MRGFTQPCFYVSVSGGTPSEDGSSVYSAEAHAKANILMTNKVNKWLGQLSTDVSVIEPTRKTRTNTGSIDFPLPSSKSIKMTSLLMSLE